MFWARPSDRRDRLEAAGARSECSGRRGGPKKLTSGRLFFWVDLAVGDQTALLARCVFRLLGRPMNYMLFFLGRARAWKPVLEGPRVYEPDRLY